MITIKLFFLKNDMILLKIVNVIGLLDYYKTTNMVGLLL